MNVGLLEQVRVQVLATPEALDMTNWGDCGTPCCIAGWTLKLSGLEPAVLETGYEVQSIARRLLRFNRAQAESLFFVSGWPPDLYTAYGKARGWRQRAAVASEALQRFMQGDWW